MKNIPNWKILSAIPRVFSLPVRQAGIFCLLGFANLKPCTGQNDTLYFNHFDSQHAGMTNNNVSCIIQDSLGYMWYGTQEGLNKFDGYGFSPYVHDPKEINSLSSDDITCMVAGKKGMIWIGTAGKGMVGFDTYSGRFIFYLNQDKNFGSNSEKHGSLSQDSITSIYADNTGLIWIGTQSEGLNSFDPKTTTFKNFRHKDADPHSISSNHITCITGNGKGLLWLGTRTDGMVAFDTRTFRSTIYRHEEQNETSISSNIIRGIYVDTLKNMIWIATANGLNKFSPVKNKFTVYLHDEQNPFSIISNNITCVFQDKFGKIWAGTADKGVSVYYAENNRFLHYNHNTNQLNSLSSNKIKSISQGRSGMMWIATTDGGLNAFNPKSLRFNLSNPLPVKYDHEHNGCISTIAESDEHTFWFGTFDDGIIEVNPSKKIANPFLHDATNPSSLYSNKITAAITDRTGTIWAGTNGGLNRIDGQTKKILRINFERPSNSLSAVKNCGNSGPSDIKITALFESRNGSILIGTCNGLFVFNTVNGKAVLFQHPKDLATTIDESTISAIAEDADGMLWVGTMAGLNSFDPVTGKFTLYQHHLNSITSIGSDHVNSICTDPRGYIWVGTQEGGLNVFNKKTQQFTSYTTRDGLPGNSVNGILEDDHYNLWIGTGFGICRVTFNNNTLVSTRLFNETDGLPTRQFGNSACLKTKDGHMLFCCSKGLITFNPDSIHPNPKEPPVVITDFKLFNKQVLPGDKNKILTTSISVTKAIHLSYNQNVFSFEFTAMSFINPEKNAYKFKMEGFDHDWRFTDYKNREATYTNLPPGNYTFRVKASNNDGVWNNTGTSIKVSIAPPFWLTWWFITSAILVLILSLILIILFRTRNLRRQKMLLEKTVEERTHELIEEKNRAEESEKFKQQFVANMSHEIRTPMNAVMGMTELVLDGKLSLQQRKYMDAIKHSSENLLVILNDILDLSKLEAGKMELEYIPFSLSGQIHFVYETFQLKANEKSLSLTIKVDKNIPDILVGDPSRLIQVLINLVGNAIKFTDKGGVEIVCTSNKNVSDEIVMVEFKIRDTGIGIPKNQVDAIFESFSQGAAEISRKYGGTGLGLSISRQLIEKQGGKLRVESEEGVGSEFSFTIAYAKGDEQMLINFNDAKLSFNAEDLKGVRILLAEDNLYNQIVAEDTLRKLIKNITVETAVNGKEVIEWLNKKSFDIVLMDIQMPEMDGFEATDFIRKKMPEPVCNIPIIAITASAIKSELKKCFDAGMNSFIAKPFDRRELLEQIALFYKKNEKGEGSKERNEPVSKTHYTDLTDLTRLTAGDTAQMESYIRMFLESAASHIRIIKESLDKGDWVTIKNSAHALKPQVKLMGIEVLANMITAVEEQIMNHQKGQLTVNLVNKVVEIIRAASDELKFELVH